MNWIPGLLPLLILMALAFSLRLALPNWGFMWALCFALFFGCKALSLWKIFRADCAPKTGRVLSYLFLWPGMDARAFTESAVQTVKPTLQEGLVAVAKTALGFILLLVVTRQIPAEQDLLRGWTGMLGMIFLLHFGLFHLIALFWQSRGVNAKKLFFTPLSATSLQEFWGKRWNDAFRQLSHDFIYRPIRNRLGKTVALLAAFLASGLIHDLVISLPARGGYGLPTAYFLIQGIGVVAEQSRFGTQLGLRQGFRGWLFTLAVTATPVFWLFHPLFVRRVILPFLAAMGAV